jgi:hypothetical protein
LTETVPRNLAAILNETIIAGMVVLLLRRRAARLIQAAHLRILHATDIFSGICPLIEEPCRMRATLDSLFPDLPYRTCAGAEIERTNMQVTARPDKRRNFRAG